MSGLGTRVHLGVTDKCPLELALWWGRRGDGERANRYINKESCQELRGNELSVLTEGLAGMEGLLWAGQRRLPGAVAVPGAQLFQASSVGIPALRYAEWPGAGCEFLCLRSGWLIDHVSAAEETHLWCGSPRANLRGEKGAFDCKPPGAQEHHRRG